jgi:hypothetical protein
MTSTESTTRHANQTPDHSRELERAITDALILAVGKRAADRALRHARARNRPVRRNLLDLGQLILGLTCEDDRDMTVNVATKY